MHKQTAHYYSVLEPTAAHKADTDNYVIPYIRALMDRHGLMKKGWRLALNDRKTALGTANSATKVIHISRFYLYRATLPTIKEVVMHEIAHALVGHAASHGPAWQRVMRTLGRVPYRTCNIKPKYT
jgi:predicted SprT family Zn-dependent metalloprotease